EGISADGSVTAQTLIASWIVPHLRPSHSLTVLHFEALLHSLVRNQRRVRLRFIPSIGHSVHSGGVFHQKTRFDFPARIGIALHQFQVKLFDPKRSVWKGPIAVSRKANLLVHIGQTEPTLLLRTIRPERHIHLVSHNPWLRCQCG